MLSRLLQRIMRIVESGYFRAYSMIPLSANRYEELEQRFAMQNGKGWGAETIRHEVNVVSELLGYSPSIFVDVGANKGLYSQEVVRRFPGVTCYLFEPSHTNVQHLRRIFAGVTNVHLIPKALSNTNSRVALYSDSPGSGLGSLSRRRLDHFGIKFDCMEQVEQVRFDQCAQLFPGESVPQIDWLKLDVEGHELDVLCGFGDIIQKVRALQFEFGGCNIDTRTFFQDFWYYFREHGFRLYRITPRGAALIPRYTEIDECFRTTNYVAMRSEALRKQELAS